jgi:hypothetical protein
MRLPFGLINRFLSKSVVLGLKFVAMDAALFCVLFFGVPNLMRVDFLVFLLPKFRLPFLFIPLPEFVDILGMF